MEARIRAALDTKPGRDLRDLLEAEKYMGSTINRVAGSTKCENRLKFDIYIGIQ
jgi:hypothetical protein